MPEHTTVKLTKALGEIPGMPEVVIQRAIDGFYHDYLSPLATPEIQLVADLRELASRPATPRNSRPLMRALADRVIAGEFDASREESDEWARSPEGQATFRQLAADVVFGGIVRRLGEQERGSERGEATGDRPREVPGDHPGSGEGGEQEEDDGDQEQ